MPKVITKANTGIKYTAKKLLRAVTRSTRRRFIDDKGQFKGSQLVNDIEMLKSLINTEKKRVQLIPSASSLCAQLFGNGPGYFAEHFAPVMAQGVGESQRIGNSVKLSGSYIKLNMRNLGGQTAPVDFKYFIIETKGEPVLATQVVTDMFFPNEWLEAYNSFPGIYDTNSAMRSLKAANYKVLKSGKFTLKGDNIAGETNQKGITIKMKYKNHHVKYDNDSVSTIVVGQLTLIVFASRGNSSTATVSTLNGVMDTAINTGWGVDRSYLNYVIDN